MNSRFEEIFSSKCKSDYRGRHFWERLGVVSQNGKVYLVRTCTQCHKSCLEELNIL